jgi:nucleotide-binding universal stress UspA family protein
MVPDMKFKTILHPTDDTKASLHALACAAAMAHQHRARLLILHVVPTLCPEEEHFPEAGYPASPASSRLPLEDDLPRVSSLLREVKLEYLLREGSPAEQIVAVAAERQCDLIVMGTQRRGWFQRLVRGSTAEQVIRKASCPVLVVKPPSQTSLPLSAAPSQEQLTSIHTHYLAERSL